MGKTSTKATIQPYHTSPSRVSPLPPSYIFDDDDDRDDSEERTFETAHSPSELHIKFQPHDEDEDDDDDYEEEDYYSSGHRHSGGRHHEEYKHYLQ